MRLIDADELKERVANAIIEDEHILEIIDEALTAYDVEKVVEQITDLTAETFKIVDNNSYIPAKKVMDIVKEGGVE